MIVAAALRSEIVNNPVAIAHTVVIDATPVSKTLPELLTLGADGSIADALNAPTRTRSASAPLAIPPFIAALSAASLTKVWTSSNLSKILDAINGQDNTAVLEWTAGAAEVGNITADEATAITALCTATTTVACSRAVELWGDGAVVSHEDVAAARVLDD